MSLPEGYASVQLPHARAFVLDAAAPSIADALERAGTLHAWAEQQTERRALAGRGRVWSVPAPVAGPDGRSRWVVRHYRRGGAVARLLGDRYLALGRPRPVVEARAAAEARARGVATPAVVAGAIYPAGPFHRADLVTEEIPDALDLADILFGDPSARVARRDALVATGRLVRRLEREGLFHPDLNAKNVVLRPGPEGPEAWLVDLDRCRVRERGGPAPAEAMRRRLERSLRKFERRTSRTLPDAEWASLRAGWEEEP